MTDHDASAPAGTGAVTLALQGGAALGAYTWGVLDRLLESELVEIEGVTGASAGAINATALAIGLSSGGRPRARELLRAVWEGLAERAAQRRRPKLDSLRWIVRNAWRLKSAAGFYELATRFAADFDIDPVSMEPLRGLLDATLDYSALARADAVRLFISATNIRTTQPRVFSGAEIDTNAVCASAAFPFLVHPVIIDGEPYWDGALVGNPLIYPVIYGCTSSDVVLVETHPLELTGTLDSAVGIMSRVMEITAAVGLVRELRMIDFVTNLLRDAPQAGHRAIRLHTLPSHRELDSLDGGGLFRADLAYFRRLHRLGREGAEQWLASDAAAAVCAAGAAPARRAPTCPNV